MPVRVRGRRKLPREQRGDCVREPIRHAGVSPRMISSRSKQKSPPSAALSPVEGITAARNAGLRYVTDTQNGFTRILQGKTFSYRNAQGENLAVPHELARIQQLAIPPAWTDVWICPSALGHIQAT